MLQRMFAALIFFCTCVSLNSQNIPEPSDFLPHQLGETFTPHHLLVDYFEAVAAASPRVELSRYGYTNEARPLMLAFVSTPENLAKLEDIRLNNLRRAGLLEGETQSNLDLSIVWLSYSVHGNEAGGSEASMLVLHDLVDPDNRRTSEWLKNTIVIIDPSLNPDGYSRYSHWYRGIAGKIVDPSLGVREHDEPWPGGRVNHYLFDLNRDWAWQTQIESRQRMVIYHQWMPHVHADVHEQGHTNPYYFAPAAVPFHDYITDWQGKFQTEIGQNHARHFDREGWLYFTRESFDLFYPSYGDTYPTFNGSIGMTYEQAGHGRSGRAIDLPTGDTLKLTDRIAHHHSTSLSTVETASRENERLVNEFGKYFTESQANPPGEYKTYIVKGDTPKGRMRALLQLLDRNGILYEKATGNATGSYYSYQEGRNVAAGVSEGDLLISAYQPRAVLTQVLFDPDARLEDSVTYDITAWSLPHAYGLDAYAATQRVKVNTTAFTMEAYQNPLGKIDLSAVYAFILPWEDFSSAQFLAAAASAGLQVRTADKAGSIDGRTFPAGSIIINKGDNRVTSNFTETVAKLVAEHEVDILPVMTGFSSSGYDLGSAHYNLIGQPKIATLAGDELNANSFGQVWYFFEQDLDYPLHIYNFSDLADIADDDIDILVIPEGYFRFDDGQSAAIASWIRGGGKLIAIGNANRALASGDAFSLSYKSSDGEDFDDDGVDPRLLPHAGAERRFISSYIPGAIIQTELDEGHPLAYALGESYASLKTNSLAFDYLDGGNVGRVRTSPLIHGFVGHNALPRIEESLSFGVENMGRGQVIYMVDNPLFRGFWQNGKLLFSNALFQVN